MNTINEKWAITGVLGYSGKHIASLVRKQGITVMGLTNSPHKPNPDHICLSPLAWGNEEALSRTLKGCTVLINTYWVRFTHGTFSHEQAIENTKTLFRAAKKAGIRRIVHVSITNPDKDSELPYFSGKAELEEYLENLHIPYSILRPAVLYGETPQESILINNMAWTLRHLPVIGIFGKGNYRMQPIHVDDFAGIACEEGARTDGMSVVINAVGSETYSYRELFKFMAGTIKCKRPIISVPPVLGYMAAKMIGWLMKDVTLTRDEVRGLMEDRLAVDNVPTRGRIALSSWMKKYASELGKNYASELKRRTQ